MGGRRRSRFAAPLVTLAALVAVTAAPLASPAPALAQGGGGADCLTAPVPAPTAAPQRLRFGITPQLAGTVGEGQGSVAPEKPRLRDRALRALEPPDRTLVIRLNRLFMSDGREGIRRFAARARRYARAGYEVESQVRYHPRPRQEGDMRKWTRFVRAATRTLARNRSLFALSITNEVNLPISENTSDGAYERAIPAIVRGVPAADRVLRRMGRTDVELGFTYAYRYTPEADARFWERIGELSTKRFRRGLDHVGLQIYPGLVWPPVLVTQTVGEATLEALALLRDCYMPKAGLGDRYEIWISENGYATNLGHTEERQAAEVGDTLEKVHALSRTLGVTDFRYFNLRDNESNGTDIFDQVGLLRPDYSRKPAFAVLRDAIRRFGRIR
ncbi:hypothetical protein HJD18_11700 [Thermoleophilia bacterium SCSIO 60948]|nr:hypothetical protein HJD18_11700 [Thermoleophilia bacterium SCSIO 60948]